MCVQRSCRLRLRLHGNAFRHRDGTRQCGRGCWFWQCRPQQVIVLCGTISTMGMRIEHARAGVRPFSPIPDDGTRAIEGTQAFGRTQSWHHGRNWAQDNAVRRSVIVGRVCCEYNEKFCVFVSGCVQALNTGSPLCASFFFSLSLSFSLSLAGL